MGPTVVVARGTTVYLVSGAGELRRFARGPPRGDHALSTAELPAELVTALSRLPTAVSLQVGGAELRQAVSSKLGRPLPAADTAAWRTVLEKVPAPDPLVERREILARAHAELETALRSPEEVLVSLAREEERTERAVGREERAAEAFVAVPGTVLAEHAAAWARTRELLTAHHRDLVGRLEAEARRTVPNLASVVGPRTAARLVAAAGGVAPLARMSSSRLQLLGSRRRPSADRGPRYGALYRAEGMEGVPPDRRAAYARSLAGLAAIAARADALTHRDVAAGLVRRRTARLDQLRRRRR